MLLYTSTQHVEKLHQFAVTLEGPVILIDCMIFLSQFLDVNSSSAGVGSELIVPVCSYL